MRKMLVMVLAVALGLGFATAAFSQGGAVNEAFQAKLAGAKLMPFEGEVLSHDVACHCIVVKTAQGELVLQDDYAKFDQEYNRAKGLKVGSKVKGEYKKVDYLNYAINIMLAK